MGRNPANGRGNRVVGEDDPARDAGVRGGVEGEADERGEEMRDSF